MAVISSRPVIPHTLASCASCGVQLEYQTPASSSTSGHQIQCFNCKTVFTHNPYEQPKPSPRRARKIGTQEKPLETGYYDILGVTVDASTDEIKKAYRRMAIRYHPDKNDDPQAEERFKEIAVAYQVLSDPTLRRKYNEFGPKEGAPDGGYMDPEEVFGAMFGGEKFVPIFGNISLARDMKTALQDDGDENAPSDPKRILSPDEKAKKQQKDQEIAVQRATEREARVSKLVENLERKLAIFTESANGVQDADITRSWRTISQIDAEELRKESYGVELLHAIGFVYVSKARHFLATSQSFMGVGGWLHGVQGKYHVFSETVGTVRAALEVKQVFEQLAEAEKAGLSPEQKKKLEEQAAEKGLQALFKGAKLEIESVLRETCDRILTPSPSTPQQKLIYRATALEILGEAYMAVKKDGPSLLDSEYVKVDTRASKERESRGGGYS